MNSIPYVLVILPMKKYISNGTNTYYLDYCMSYPLSRLFGIYIYIYIYIFFIFGLSKIKLIEVVKRDINIKSLAKSMTSDRI